MSFEVYGSESWDFVQIAERDVDKDIEE